MDIKDHSIRFLVGFLLIIISFIVGFITKPGTFLYILHPASASLFIKINFYIYILTWVLLFFGVYLCGREGYKAAKHWYYDLHKKSFNHVTRQTKRGIRKVTELNNKRKTKSKLKSQNRSKLKSQKKSAISKKK